LADRADRALFHRGRPSSDALLPQPPSFSQRRIHGNPFRLNRSTKFRLNDGQRSRSDVHLQELLCALALLLVPSGVTPKHFAELAKYAFVDAAGQISKFRNGRLNQSRIAVITGLNRAEVKRLLAEGRGASSPGKSRASRAARVVSGWVSDRRYLDSSGRPRTLPISGYKISFATLVKEYGGDVPHRAVLDELKRTRAVRQLHSRLSLNTGSSGFHSRLSSRLARVLPLLLDGMHVAATSYEHRAELPLYRLTLSAKNSVELAILRDRIVGGVGSMLAGFKGSLASNSRTRPRSTASTHTITVTTLIRERRPTKKK
jgi:hypothetical protein